MKLTGIKVSEAKPSERERKLSDGAGLYLLVKPNGTKAWRYKYRFNGKELTLALGVFPEISLKQARHRHQAARDLLANGVDPNQDRRDRKLASAISTANTFGAIAAEFDEIKMSGLAPTTLARNRQIIRDYLIPVIGARPADEIRPAELLAALRRVESSGAIETAKRARSLAGQIFRYGVSTGRCERDPSADLKGALMRSPGKHFAAIVDPKRAGKLMADIAEYPNLLTRGALHISAYCFARPGVIRAMEWSEINGDRWEIPAAKMKGREDHIVPLSTQALAVLEEMEALSGGGRYVFPSARGPSRCMSENAVRVALRSMGYSNEDHTPHGFRAMARTLLDESLRERIEIVEMQLAHTVRDTHGKAYNRTSFIEDRTAMMQRWSDFLDTLRDSAGESNVVPLRGAR
jgi:integrase